MNQRQHEGSPGPEVGFTGVRQGTHLEKRVRFSGPGSRGASSRFGPVVGIDHVQVAAPAGCEDAARRYYGVLLGLDEVPKPARLAQRGGVWFRLGVEELHVGVSETFAPATKAHPALRVASAAALERLAARLADAGVAVTWADDGEIPGARRFFASDPWGNRIELVARLG